MDDEAARAAPEIRCYDLAPVRAAGPAPKPLRQLGRRAYSPPRWSAPPVPDGHVRVRLSDDYYTGATWWDWPRSETDWPGAVFDIPSEQRERWLQAQAAYAVMQSEIDDLMSERAARIPPGWVGAAPRISVSAVASPLSRMAIGGLWCGSWTMR